MKLDMQVEARTPFRRLDFNFISVIAVLNVVGLITIYSATHGAHSSGLSRVFLMQGAWWAIGWFLFLVMTFVDYKIFYRFAYLLYGLNVAALVAVTFWGSTYYGAQRWLDLKVFRYQPSETMKIALVLVLARVLSRYNRRGGLNLKDLMIPGLLTLIPFGLVVRQPDLGTALMLIAIAVSMLLFVKVKRVILVSAFVIAVVSGPLAFNFGLKEYQKQRVMTFLNPGKDPRGAGYNSIEWRLNLPRNRQQNTSNTIAKSSELQENQST